MISLVQSAIDLLDDIAIDDRHGPRLYARFFKGLLAKVNAPHARNHGKTRQSKSSSPVEAYLSSPGSTRNSLSPQPNHAALSFDQFAPPGGIADPFANNYMSQNLNAVNMSDFFYPPLPYDSDIMQGMQTLADPAWSDMASLPGEYGPTRVYSTADYFEGLNLVAQFQNQPMAYNYMQS